jgi:hypothetical protein
VHWVYFRCCLTQICEIDKPCISSKIRAISVVRVFITTPGVFSVALIGEAHIATSERRS